MSLTCFKSPIVDSLSLLEDALDEDPEGAAGRVASADDGEAEWFPSRTFLQRDGVIRVSGGSRLPREGAEVGRVGDLGVAVPALLGSVVRGVRSVHVHHLPGTAEREGVFVGSPVADDLPPEQLVVHAAIARVLSLVEVRARAGPCLVRR